MSKKKSLITFAACFLMLAGVFFVLSNVKAYDNQNGHSLLTKQIAELYNKVYQPNLTKSQIQQLVQGSSDEDTAPRWINHFYDPTTGKEWLGKRLGSISEEQVRQISKIVFGKDPVSALNWAHNQGLQDADYRLYQGNRTFESAVLFYSEGDKDKAFYNLGHILHLIEDMTVPAHTRQDSHFDMPVPELFKAAGVTPDKGEAYENWAKNYTSQNQGLNLVDILKNNYQPICYSLDDCLNILAQYSNNNFFSSDSILDKDYSQPKVKEYIDIAGYTYAYDMNNFLLFRAKKDKKTDILIEKTVNTADINQAYWDNLAPKAVLAGVEVIKYFQDQVEKAKNEEIVLKKPAKPNFFALLGGISPWGELAKVGKFAEGVKQEFYARLDDAWKELNLSINDFYNRLISFNPFLAFTPPSFSIEETIFSEEIEPPPDPFAEEDPRDKTDEILTGIVEYITGTGGPILNFDFQDQENVQEALDDIYEKFDILRQQALKFIEEYNSKNDQPKDQSQDEQDKKDEDNDDQAQQQNNPPKKPIGGGGSNTVYSKILISEVQVTGLTDQKEEFVELYNPNTTEIDLTGWYLQKKTKTGSNYSSFVPNTLFSGKKIRANDYFIIARENSSFVSSANIITENSLAEDNSLILKNPNGEIADKLGFGSAQEYETSPAQNPEKGQSIGRKWDTVNNIEQDIDNNFADFEAQNPTPKAKNSAYVVPPDTPSTPTDKTAPGVAFTLGAIQTSLFFTINFDITDPITTVSPSGIDSYVFRWQEEGAPPAGGWQEDAPVKVSGGPAIANLTKDFTGQDETTYYFQIKTKDVAGNVSDWQPETFAQTKISIFKKILINEIQTEGVAVKDEFVELYNPNSVDINLSGFELKKKTSGGIESNLVSSSKFLGIIKAKGFLLIAPQKNDDDTENYTGLAVPDLRYSGKTFSIASNNTILIYNKNGVLLDKVGFGTAKDFETAPTVNPDASKSIERKKIGIDTDDNSADFRISGEPTPKAGSPESHIWDGTGDVLKGSPPDYSNSRVGGSGVDYYELKIKWNSNSPNLDFYDVQYKVNDNSWQDWALRTTETEKTYNAYYSMFTDYVYYFRVRAQDKEGNQGDWAEVTVDVTNPVIINEVALLGTNASKYDQWIELYNRSDKDVDLTGWRIISGASGSISLDKPLQGIIPAKGYFLLEFGYDDNNISDIIADQVLLAYVSQYIELKNQNNRQIDQFYVPMGGGRWFWQESDFVKDGNYHSMERISPYAFGSHHKNWIINNGITINGADRDGNSIYGTPGQQNSNYQIYTPLSEDFAENITLPLSRSPYLLHSISLSVHKNKTLTIEPGVVMKFYDSYGYAGLKIEGTLKAIGGSDLPIVFTSFFDDQYGGDIDGDAGQTNLVAGNWGGLQFTKDATNLSELDNVVVRYAGSLFANLGSSGIRVNQVSISLKNSIIEKNLESGILLLNSSSIIDSVNFLDNKIVPGYYPHGGIGVYIQGGSPQITNSYFRGNVYGVKMHSWWDETNKTFPPFPTIASNNFESNKNPIYVGDNSHPSFANNQATNNDLNAIVIEGSISSDTTWQKDLVYVIRAGISIYPNAVLTIDPGVIVKFYDKYVGMEIRGTLKAIGGSDLPIVFTALNDDEYGYGDDKDTDQDNGENPAVPGSWLGLYFSKDATNLSELDYIVLRYGGNLLPYTHGAGIKADQVAISLSNSIIEKNANNGLWLVNSSSIIDSSHFTAQILEGGKGIYVQGGNPEIKNSHIWDNYYGLYVERWLDIDNAEFWINFLLNNNSVVGNTKADIWDVDNPPPPPEP